MILLDFLLISDQLSTFLNRKKSKCWLCANLKSTERKDSCRSPWTEKAFTLHRHSSSNLFLRDWNIPGPLLFNGFITDSTFTSSWLTWVKGAHINRRIALSFYLGYLIPHLIDEIPFSECWLVPLNYLCHVKEILSPLSSSTVLNLRGGIKEKRNASYHICIDGFR